MAIGALQSRAEVHLMGEIDKIGKALEPNPRHRAFVLPIRQQFVGFRSPALEVAMTTQTQLHGGNPGGGGYFSGPMAIGACDL